MDEQKVEFVGVSSFFYAAIPVALGAAALIWLSFATGVIEFHHAQIQEGRRDERVGASGDIRTPVNLIFNGKGCIEVTRAFLDGDSLTAYLHNKCTREIKDISWAVRELASDGTTVESTSNYLSGSDDMLGDEKREQQVSISSDKRVTNISFAIASFNDFK